MFSAILAAIWGVILDILGTYLSFPLAFTVVAGVLALAGRDPAAALAELGGSPAGTVILTLYGLSFTVLGGYTTAKIARADKLRCSLAMGFLSVLFSLLTTYYGPREVRLSLAELAPMALGLPAALGGGYLGSRDERRQGLRRVIVLSFLSFTFLGAAALTITALLLGLGAS